MGTAEEVAAARAELFREAKRLEQYLDTGGRNGEAWEHYLLWDELTAQLAEGATVDRSVLDSRMRWMPNASADMN